MVKEPVLVGQPGEGSLALGSLAQIVTIGTKGGDRTVMCTGSEVPVAPLVSVALVVKVYSPAGGFVQKRQNRSRRGLLVTIPRLLVPAKNSTVVTNVSRSRAVAQMEILTGAVNLLLFVGFRMC